jgi:hypothetical protein
MVSEGKLSLLAKVADVRSLIVDARLLAAEAELDALERLHAEARNTEGFLVDGSSDADEVQRAIDDLNGAELRDRCRRIRDCIAESASTMDETKWTLGSQMFGVTTHYQVESDGNLLLRMEGVQDDLSFFDLVAVGFEMSLFSTWMPMCTRSELMKRIGMCEFGVKLEFGGPFPFMLTRDAFVHIFAADCLKENEKVVVLCESIDTGAIDGLDVPPVVRSFFHDRVDLKSMKFVFEITSPSCAQVIYDSRIMLVWMNFLIYSFMFSAFM